MKVSDIDSERLLLRIEQGQGRKDRFAMLSRFSWRYRVLSKGCRLRSFGYSLFLLPLSMQRARPRLRRQTIRRLIWSIRTGRFMDASL